MPRERVLTPYGIGTVLGPSAFGADFRRVLVDGMRLPDHLPASVVRPVHYPQQLAAGARPDNPSYTAAIEAEVRREPNPYLEAQK